MPPRKIPPTAARKKKEEDEDDDESMQSFTNDSGNAVNGLSTALAKTNLGGESNRPPSRSHFYSTRLDVINNPFDLQMSEGPKRKGR